MIRRDLDLWASAQKADLFYTFEGGNDWQTDIRALPPSVRHGALYFMVIVKEHQVIEIWRCRIRRQDFHSHPADTLDRVYPPLPDRLTYVHRAKSPDATVPHLRKRKPINFL